MKRNDKYDSVEELLRKMDNGQISASSSVSGKKENKDIGEDVLI